MKAFSLIPLLFFTSLSITAQSRADIDSLLNTYTEQSDDTVKLKTINSIVNYYMYRDIEEAGRFARRQLELAGKLKHPTGIALANYQIGVYYYNLDNADSSSFYYTESLRIAREINNAVYISQALRGLAIIAFSQGKLLLADSINNLDLINTRESGDSVGLALAYDFKGTINQNKGYYSIALDNVLKGLKLFELLRDSIRIADCYNHLATLEKNIGNLQNGITYNEKALRIYEAYEDTYYQAQALNDIGVMYKSLNMPDTALSYFNRSIEKSRLAKVSAIEAAVLTNIGATFLDMKETDDAIKYLNESISLSKKINAARRVALTQNRLAETYLLLNQPARAINYARAAKEYSDKNENISIARVSLRHLSSAYEQSNPSLALNYHKQYKTLSDSILNREKINRIEELRVQFSLKEKEVEIAIQEAEIDRLIVEAQNERLTKTLYAGGMFSFISIAGLLFFGFRQRIKKNNLRHEKEEALLKKEIEFKKKELASQTLHLVQKSTFIQELKENLEKIKQSPELFKIEFRRLIMLLKKEHSEDKDWEVFKTYFSEVHNDFDKRIKSISDEVTENEIRLASFLRMNLSTKEIASMLNVLPDSILKSKYRLKQKLNLEKDVDLTQFLNSL